MPSALRGRPRRSWALDLVLAVLVVLVGLASYETGLSALAVALLMAPLLLVRRVWPVPVNLLILVVGLVSFRHSNLMLQVTSGMIAVHTLTVLAPARLAVAGLALAEGWVVIATLGSMSALNSVAQKVLIFVGLSTPQVLAFVLGQYRRDRDRRQQELIERNRHLEVEREQRDQLAAADERARIAREMHDLIAHHLTVVVALSEGLARSGEITSDRSRQAVATTVAMARQALQETRRLFGAMPAEEDARQPVPDLGFLDGLVAQVRATGLPITYEVEGEPPADASSGLQLTVYRLVQEALTNSLKHAQEVTRTVVRLQYRPDVIAVTIEDDGRGGDDAAAKDGPGRGIIGMRQRVQSFGGTVQAGPGPSGGWRVRADFPLNTDHGVRQ